MLTILKKIVQEVSAEPDLTPALNKLVHNVKDAINTECCSVYLADYEKQSYLLMATEGLSQEAVGKVAVGFNEGVIGLVGQREEPINLSDVQSHPNFKHTPQVQEERFNAFLGTPIIHHRKVLGILTVQQHEFRQFTEMEEAFLVTLAAQLAAVIAHAEARGALGVGDGNVQHWLTNLQGVPSSPGIAIGEVYLYRNRADLSVIALRRVTQDEVAAQRIRYDEAVRITITELDELSQRMSEHVQNETLELFEVYKHLLSASSLGNAVTEHIDNGWCAISSLKIATDTIVSQFESLEDEYIRERAVDVRDLGNRVLRHMMERKEERRAFPEQMVLVAEEVTASMLAELPRGKLQGIVSMRGSSNSHAAILARALAVPAVFGVEDIPLAQMKGQEIIVDGYSGRLFLSPSDILVKEYRQLLDEENELQELVEQQSELPARTSDGKDICLQMNAGLGGDYDAAQNNGAEGIGLYRTEFPFMMRSSFPSESEQCALYQAVLEQSAEFSVTMRTLDIGGDKSLSYFPIVEDNPFLGWRGIRVTLDHPEIFLLQVRAMMRANATHNNLQILLPMVGCVLEVDEANRLIQQAYDELVEELDYRIVKPKVGVMIEVPSIVYMIDKLAGKIDFLSVGSNDLTQYLLAVDRNNSRVANLYKPYHPAVLHCLNDIIQRAKAVNLPVSICGEIASDPGLILLLIAMGYDSFSMSGHHINKIKWIVRNSSVSSAQDILEYCLQQSSPEAIRTAINQYLEDLGLGGFIRAGK